ncbi:MAG: LicD family protein [Hungatella sp.]|nr:LicD family protein [Hungatella sp.]
MDFNLEPENRCGYEVSAKLKKIWKTELQILQEIIRVCNKYHLRLTMWAGSMLGGVRHQGFIPWDDDLDVALLREDYEKLVEVADKEFKKPLFFQTALTDSKFFFGYARLRNSETTGMITWNQSSDYNNGIYVDIYVLDGYDDKKANLRRQLQKRDFISQFLNTYYADDTYQSRKPAMVTKLFQSIAHVHPYEYWNKRYTNIITEYNDTATRVSLMTHEEKDIKKYWCSKSDFNEIIKLPFENMEVPILKNYDKILRNFYGNYMEFPPVELRGAWHENLIIFEPDIPYREYLAFRGAQNDK